MRAQWLAGIEQEKARPQTAAMRVMPPLLYGAGHAYAIPFTGSGTTESIKSLTRDDLVAFHRDWLQPEQARIVIAGDTTLKEIVPQLEARFGDWKSAPNAPQLPAVTTAARPGASRVFLINQPGAIQSNIYVGQLIPPTGDASTIDFDFANGVLGGEFSSRLNMNLREDKHWAYGSYSNAGNAKGQRPWMASAAVQSDKTVESIGELKREIEAFVSGERPVTEAEVAKIRASNTLSLPGGYETASALLGQVASNLRYGRPQDYILQYKARNEAMTPALTQTAAKTIDPKCADLGGSRRPGQDRDGHPRSEPGRGAGGRRRRQAGNRNGGEGGNDDAEITARFSLPFATCEGRVRLPRTTTRAKALPGPRRDQGEVHNGFCCIHTRGTTIALRF